MDHLETESYLSPSNNGRNSGSSDDDRTDDGEYHGHDDDDDGTFLGSLEEEAPNGTNGTNGTNGANGANGANGRSQRGSQRGSQREGAPAGQRRFGKKRKEADDGSLLGTFEYKFNRFFEF